MSLEDSFMQYEMLLREFISPSVSDLELRDDDPSWNLMGTFAPESIGGRMADGAAGYEMSYRIKVQSGGRVSAGTFAGNSLVAMGKDSHLAMGQAADAKYLDPRKTPLPAWIIIKMILRRIKGGLSKNHQQVMAQLASRPIDEVAGEDLEDATRRVRNYLLNALYGNRASIAQVNNASSVAVPETAGGIICAIDNGTIMRFMKGDLLVGATDSSGISTQIAGAINGYFRVVNIDVDNRSIYLQSEPGEGTITLTDNAHLILAGTYNFASTTDLTPHGYLSLLINTGNFPGSAATIGGSELSVLHHSELMAFIIANSPAKDPTMSAFTEVVDKMLDAGKEPPTAWISERGVWTYMAQLDQEANALVQVPMGQTFQAAGGVAGPNLGHQNNRFRRFSSPRIAPNSCIAISPETWRRFMPMGDRTIHWVIGTGMLAGQPSIFRPVTDGTQLTELGDAPFNSYVEFGCVDPRRNFLVTGLKAQRDT